MTPLLDVPSPLPRGFKILSGTANRPLAEEVAKIKAMETSFGGPPFEGKLLIVSNQHTPYSIISSVLTSAGLAQYSQFKLVVMKKNDGK